MNDAQYNFKMLQTRQMEISVKIVHYMYVVVNLIGIVLFYYNNRKKVNYFKEKLYGLLFYYKNINIHLSMHGNLPFNIFSKFRNFCSHLLSHVRLNSSIVFTQLINKLSKFR